MFILIPQVGSGLMSPNDSIDSNMVAYGSGSSSLSRVDDWSIPSRIALASIGSQGTMGGLVIAGFVSVLDPCISLPLLLLLFSFFGGGHLLSLVPL